MRNASRFRTRRLEPFPDGQAAELEGKGSFQRLAVVMPTKVGIQHEGNSETGYRFPPA